MKLMIYFSKFRFLAILAIVFFCNASIAQPPPEEQEQEEREEPRDPIDANFFPPDLVMHARQAIGLSEEQRTELHQSIQKMEQQIRPLEQRMENEHRKLASLLKKTKLDQTEVLSQMERMHNLEGQVRRLHITLLIKIKNMLTPEQQAKLRPMKKAMRTVHEKMERVERRTREWEEQGLDMWEIESHRFDCELAIEAGDFKGAEAALDRILDFFEDWESK